MLFSDSYTPPLHLLPLSTFKRKPGQKWHLHFKPFLQGPTLRDKLSEQTFSCHACKTHPSYTLPGLQISKIQEDAIARSYRVTSISDKGRNYELRGFSCTRSQTIKTKATKSESHEYIVVAKIPHYVYNCREVPPHPSTQRQYCLLSAL